jgi:hypothetical protein
MERKHTGKKETDWEGGGTGENARFFVVLFPYVETQQTIFSTMVIEPPAMLANSHTSV